MTARRSTVWLSIVAVLLNVFSAPSVVARAFGPEPVAPAPAPAAESEHCGGQAAPNSPADPMDQAASGGMDHGGDAGCCESKCDCGWLPVAAPVATLAPLSSAPPSSALAEPPLPIPATVLEFVLRPPITRAI